MSFWLPNGAGESVGDTLASGKNLVQLASGLVYYVGATNAADASNTGLEALRPFATIGQANTTAGDFDIVVIRDGFSQTLTASLAVNEAIIFAGGGSNSGDPTVSLGLNAAATTLLNVSGNAEFRNIKFVAPSQSNTAPRIIVSGAVVRFIGCRFEANGNDAGGVFRLDNGITLLMFDNCEFVNTSTDVASRPGSFILLNSTAVAASVYTKGCTFDVGTVGMDNTSQAAGSAKKGYALDFTEAALGVLHMEETSFLRGADVGLHASSPGFIQASTVTGGAFVRNV